MQPEFPNSQDTVTIGQVVACHRCEAAATRICPTCHRSFCDEHFPPSFVQECGNCAEARRDGFLVALLGVMTSIHTHVDFRDKALKILGSVAKVASVVQEKNADTKSLASELSRVRKWLKFLKILRMYRGNLKNLRASENGMTRLEILADFAQMISEDLSTLHRSGVWTGLLKFPVIKDIAVWEDRAWLFWATAAFVNSLRDLDTAVREYFAASEIEKEKKKPKLIGCILNSLKFACEIGDSGMAVMPVNLKRGKENSLTVASALLGGTSALCSIHKFLYPSYY